MPILFIEETSMERGWGMSKVLGYFYIFFFSLLFGVMLGYTWRLHYEHINHNEWKKSVVWEFLREVEEHNQQVLKFGKWVFIKRADGSFVVKRKEAQ